MLPIAVKIVVENNYPIRGGYFRQSTMKLCWLDRNDCRASQLLLSRKGNIPTNLLDGLLLSDLQRNERSYACYVARVVQRLTDD